jgi:hypothetical protein
MIVVTSSGPVEYEEKGERHLVPKDLWPTLSLSELFEQKTILYERWEFIKSKGFSYEDHFLEGLHTLENVIQNKLNEQLSS